MTASFLNYFANRKVKEILDQALSVLRDREKKKWKIYKVFTTAVSKRHETWGRTGHYDFITPKPDDLFILFCPGHPIEISHGDYRIRVAADKTTYSGKRATDREVSHDRKTATQLRMILSSAYDVELTEVKRKKEEKLKEEQKVKVDLDRRRKEREDKDKEERKQRFDALKKGLDDTELDSLKKKLGTEHKPVDSEETKAFKVGDRVTVLPSLRFGKEFGYLPDFDKCIGESATVVWTSLKVVIAVPDVGGHTYHWTGEEKGDEARKVAVSMGIHPGTPQMVPLVWGGPWHFIHGAAHEPWPRFGVGVWVRVLPMTNSAGIKDPCSGFRGRITSAFFEDFGRTSLRGFGVEFPHLIPDGHDAGPTTTRAALYSGKSGRPGHCRNFETKFLEIADAPPEPGKKETGGTSPVEIHRLVGKTAHLLRKKSLHGEKVFDQFEKNERATTVGFTTTTYNRPPYGIVYLAPGYTVRYSPGYKAFGSTSIHPSTREILISLKDGPSVTVFPDKVECLIGAVGSRSLRSIPDDGSLHRMLSEILAPAYRMEKVTPGPVAPKVPGKPNLPPHEEVSF